MFKKYTEVKNFFTVIIISLFLTAILIASLLFLFMQSKARLSFPQQIDSIHTDFVFCSFTIIDKRDLLLTIRIDFHSPYKKNVAERTVILQGRELFFTFSVLSVQGANQRLIFPINIYSDIVPESNAISLCSAYMDTDGYPLIYTGKPFSSISSQETLRQLFHSVQNQTSLFIENKTIGVRKFTVNTSYDWIYNMQTHTMQILQK